MTVRDSIDESSCDFKTLIGIRSDLNETSTRRASGKSLATKRAYYLILDEASRCCKRANSASSKKEWLKHFTSASRKADDCNRAGFCSASPAGFIRIAHIIPLSLFRVLPCPLRTPATFPAEQGHFRFAQGPRWRSRSCLAQTWFRHPS